MPIELSLFTGSRRTAYALLASILCLPASAAAAEKSSGEAARVRARAIGIAPGTYEPGPLNAITDVDGVRVGQITLVIGESTRTGVTAVLAHAGNLFQDKVPAGLAVANGFGKLAGATAPLSDRNLERLARRTPTVRSTLTKVSELPNDQVSPLFVAVADATEEAIYNSLLMATSMSSIDATGQQVPIKAIDAAAVRSAVERRRKR